MLGSSQAELVLSLLGVVAVVAVYCLLATVSLRERVTKLEEWIRQQERRNGGTK